MTKKIAIIGTVGLPAQYGGFESLAEYLTKHLGQAFDMTVFCSSPFYKKKIKTYNHAHLKYIPLNANGVQSILYDIICIVKALFFADVLLILGVSGCIVLPFIKLVSSKKILVNIDGLEWKRAKWGKAAKWFLKYSETLAVKHADIVIADNKIIQDYVWEHYHIKSTLIAYGSDHCKKEKIKQKVLKVYPFLKNDYAFKVCRIEPENNIHLILEAFSEFTALHIMIVGNWNNSTYGKHLKEQFGAFENIHLVDPIYNQNILNQIRSNCYVYIHGHSAGGTNPSLVEAMYLELPIFCYDANYNIETTCKQAAYFHNKTDLINLLRKLNTERLKLIGFNLKEIANTHYCWVEITKQYASLFNLN
jgi:glycosyltransferase involved in cell wall biosynthesis